MGENKKNMPPQTLEEALTQLKELEVKNAELTNLLEEQNDHINKLEAKAAKGGGAQKPTVKVGKKEYEVACGYRGKGGKVFKPAQIAEDTELAASILKIEGQTILMEIESEKGGSK